MNLFKDCMFCFFARHCDYYYFILFIYINYLFLLHHVSELIKSNSVYNLSHKF